MTRKTPFAALALGLVRPLPGIALALGVTIVALAIETAESRWLGRAWIDGLIVAILLGAAIRTVWTPPVIAATGLAVAQKTLLELAIVLLGLSIGVATILRTGPTLMAGVAVTVLLAIAASYAIGRGFGLPHRLAVLIACGNAICGNTAIVAVAPVIDAEQDDVAAAIAFTAVLGIVVVLGIPPLVMLIGFGQIQAGVLAGLTVYSVSQVFAATAPIGALAVQVATLIKLARMLMLGPILLGLSLAGRRREANDVRRIDLGTLAPWFIIGFVAMIGLRSTGLVPTPVVTGATGVANVLIVVAMAALGLSVDVRVIGRAGGRVMSVVALSLATLGTISLGVTTLLVR